MAPAMTEEQVAAAEKCIGCRLPMEYRLFLLRVCASYDLGLRGGIHPIRYSYSSPNNLNRPFPWIDTVYLPGRHPTLQNVFSQNMEVMAAVDPSLAKNAQESIVDAKQGTIDVTYEMKPRRSLMLVICGQQKGRVWDYQFLGSRDVSLIRPGFPNFIAYMEAVFVATGDKIFPLLFRNPHGEVYDDEDDYADY